MPLTIVMYHYVRDLKKSDYHRIKGLDVSLFKDHISHIRRQYTPVRVEDVLKALKRENQLPDNAVLLTFDDGYADHFEHVFPLLQENDMQGAFYVPVQAITEHKVLDANKIHFILAANEDIKAIIEEIRALVRQHSAVFNLEAFETYYKKLAHPTRFDTAEVIFIKRLLQVELPIEVREMITDTLFLRYVGMDEEQFSKKLYVSRENLRSMLSAGMHVGAHGYRHEWMGCMCPQEQLVEIEQSVAFLDQLGINKQLRTICYPYGSYDGSLLTQLKSNSFQLGMSTTVAVADLSKDNRLTLPRIDANDLTAEMITKKQRIH